MNSFASLETAVYSDHLAVIEAFHDAGWTDGLPVVPPTPKLVEAMIVAGGRPGEEVLGTLHQRDRELTVWQAATCAVMAGCLPVHFPIVVTSWDALFDDRFNLHAVLTSTGGAAIAGIVSGPIAFEIGMNCGSAVFGPGNRANASIGRAIRLGAMAVLGARPGELDASSFGTAGKYTFHFAERPPAHGWPTLREQLGYPESATTVTVVAVEGPRQIAQRLNPDPSGLLATIASCMRNPSHNGTGKGTYYIVALGPEHEYVLATGGLQPPEIRRELSTRSRISETELAAAGVFIDHAPMYGMRPGADGLYRTAEEDDIAVVTTGGPGAGWSMAVPCWTGRDTSRPSTRAVGGERAAFARPHDGFGYDDGCGR